MSNENLDMKKIGETVRNRRQELKYSQGKVAKLSAIAQPYLSEIEEGKKTPSLDVLARVAVALNLTISDLLVSPPTRVNSNHADGVCISGEIDSNAYYDPDEVQVPLYRMTSICAGHGVDNGTTTPEVVKKIPVKRSAIGHSPDSAYIALEVCGHSMEPRIPDGSTIVIDTSRKDPSHGDICYVRFRRNGGFEKDVIRFCYKDRNGGLELRAAEGNGIPSDYFSRDDLNEGYVQIVGVAVAKLTLERL